MESGKNLTNVGKQKNKGLGGIYVSALICKLPAILVTTAKQKLYFHYFIVRNSH